DAPAEQADLGRALQYDRHQRLSPTSPTVGPLHRSLPFPPELFGLFRTSDADTRFSERRLANDVALVSLYAVGAVRNARSGSGAESLTSHNGHNGTLRIKTFVTFVDLV